MAGCAWRFVICISVLKSLMPQPSALHRFAHSATPTTRDAARTLQAHLLGHRQQPWGADTQDLRAAQVLERHRRAALRKVLRGGAALRRRVFHRHIEPTTRVTLLGTVRLRGGWELLGRRWRSSTLPRLSETARPNCGCLLGAPRTKTRTGAQRSLWAGCRHEVSRPSPRRCSTSPPCCSRSAHARAQRAAEWS